MKESKYLQSTLTEESFNSYGNKLWRLQHLYKVKNEQGQIVPFKLRPAQIHYFYKRHNNNVILKSRQLGFTTFHVIDYLDDCLFEANSIDCAIIADTLKNVRRIFQKVQLAWQELPQTIKSMVDVRSDSKNELSFSNGSSIMVVTDARSGTYQRLHISELGKISRKYPMRAYEIVTGAIPAVPMGGKISIESTAEGDYGYYYDLFSTAREYWATGEKLNQKQFKPFFYNWTLDKKNEIREEVPIINQMLNYQKIHGLTDSQIRWYQETKHQLGKFMPQEHPTTIDEAFVSTGDKYFDVDDINDRIRFAQKPIERRQHELYWEKPEVGVEYMLGADVAEGYGGDSSTICVIRRDNGKQVYEFCANTIKVDNFSRKIYKVGKEFNWAIAGVERNNHGLTVLTLLNGGIVDEQMIGHTRTSVTKKYPNIYRQKTVDRKTNMPSAKMGWYTDSASKPLMLDEFDMAFTKGDIQLNSIPLLNEMKTFSSDELVVKRGHGDMSKHFDRVIAVAIAWQMRKTSSRMGITKAQLGIM